jgi:hypothetical protein
MVREPRMTEHRRSRSRANWLWQAHFCFESRTGYAYSCEHSLSFVYEPTSVLKLAIKVWPQILNIAGRGFADINHTELLSARRGA